MKTPFFLLDIRHIFVDLKLATMKKTLLFILLFCSKFTYSQTTVKLTGGVSLTRGNIDADVLNEVIQQKQEEVFARLFQNIVVEYFKPKNLDIENQIYNFPTFYSIYNIVSDLTIGKSKTTVSKAVINSVSEMAYIYAFVRYYQEYERGQHGLILPANQVEENLIQNADIEVEVSGKNKLKGVKANDKVDMIRLNLYLEAAFDVLAKDESIQKEFAFSRPLTSNEINIWYEQIGLIHQLPAGYTFQTVTGATTTLPQLIANMKLRTASFLTYAGSDNLVKLICKIKKTGIGFPDNELKKDAVEAIRLALYDYGNKSDKLFDQNVVKALFTLLIENIHYETDENGADVVYLDVESLILSLSKEFVTKQQRSSVSSPLFFINPRPFFTIGTSTAVFINNNELDIVDGKPARLKNVNLASEKIGFRVKLWDGGYTHSFKPGEVYQYHGYNYVWNQPQTRPLVSSVYYNIYASGLLYNVLNLKTNDNFHYGFIGSNFGLQFFNGLELSTGAGWVYKDGLSNENVFLKLDFDVPIIDYLSALAKKNKKN